MPFNPAGFVIISAPSYNPTPGARLVPGRVLRGRKPGPRPRGPNIAANERDIDNLDAFTGALTEETATQNGGIFGDMLVEEWSDQFFRSIARDWSLLPVVGDFACSMRACVTKVPKAMFPPPPPTTTTTPPPTPTPTSPCAPLTKSRRHQVPPSVPQPTPPLCKRKMLAAVCAPM